MRIRKISGARDRTHRQRRDPLGDDLWYFSSHRYHRQRPWNENGLVARMSRICKSTVPEMIAVDTTSANIPPTATAACCATTGWITTRPWKTSANRPLSPPPRGGFHLLPPRWTDGAGDSPLAGRRRLHQYSDHVLLVKFASSFTVRSAASVPR